MATPTLAPSNSPQNPQLNEGSLVESLIDLVERAEKKQPQPDGYSIPDAIRSDEERKEANARMLNALWEVGEESFKNALGGFRDVNSYQNYYDCQG